MQRLCVHLAQHCTARNVNAAKWNERTTECVATKHICKTDHAPYKCGRAKRWCLPCKHAASAANNSVGVRKTHIHPSGTTRLCRQAVQILAIITLQTTHCTVLSDQAKNTRIVVQQETAGNTNFEVADSWSLCCGQLAKPLQQRHEE